MNINQKLVKGLEEFGKNIFFLLPTSYFVLLFLVSSSAFAAVAKVEFYRDNTKIGEDTSAPYTFSTDTTSTSNGSHTFSAKAYDAAGNVTTSSINTVNVSNNIVDPGPWVKGFGGTGSDIGRAVAVDDSGNSYVVGYFSGQASFGGDPLVSAGGFDMYLAKYSAAGVQQWSYAFGGSGDETPVGITLKDGYIYVTGFFTDSSNLGGQTFTSFGSYDIYVAKYSLAGGHLKSVQFGGPKDDVPKGIAVDLNGHIVLGGTFQGTAGFGGPTSLTSASGGTDLFVGKYDQDFGHLWSKKFNNSSMDILTSLAMDKSGNIFLGGYFNSWINFGESNLITAGGTDIFLAKLNPNGDHLWSHKYGATTDERIETMAVDSNGDVLISGIFFQTVSFGVGVPALTSVGDQDLFLAKYAASNGDHVWSKRYGGIYIETPASMAIDSSGSIWLVGTFATLTHLGGDPLTGLGLASDIFVANYSSTGEHLASKRFGGTQSEEASSVVLHIQGYVLVTGQFMGNTQLNGQTIPSVGSYDMFLMRLSL